MNGSKDRSFLDNTVEQVAQGMEETRHALRTADLKIQEATEKGKYETNKAIAKDPNLPMEQRTDAALEVVNADANEASAAARQADEKMTIGL